MPSQYLILSEVGNTVEGVMVLDDTEATVWEGKVLVKIADLPDEAAAEISRADIAHMLDRIRGASSLMELREAIVSLLAEQWTEGKASA